MKPWSGHQELEDTTIGEHHFLFFSVLWYLSRFKFQWAGLWRCLQCLGLSGPQTQLLTHVRECCRVQSPIKSAAASVRSIWHLHFGKAVEDFFSLVSSKPWKWPGLFGSKLTSPELCWRETSLTIFLCVALNYAGQEFPQINTQAHLISS